MAEDIYRDGTYLQLNPTLHEEDSDYKLRYILELLRGLNFDSSVVRVLDIGGGAGVIAAKVCEHLARDHARVECHALDLSPQALAIQKKNNPYCTLAASDAAEIRSRRYDLALLIDVIEHIPNNSEIAGMVDQVARYAVYNIPTEINLVDWLRNLYMRGRYYPSQTDSLGHIHFYSARAAKGFVKRHHRLKRWIFPDIPGHCLTSPAENYERQRANRLRFLELRISSLIYRFLKPVAPWLIQGSLFMLAECGARANRATSAQTGSSEASRD